MIGIIDVPGSSNPYPVAAGGFLLGSVSTCCLYGIHLSQLTRYYHRFGRTDRVSHRFVLVPLVFCLSSCHIALVILAMNHYFVQGILDPTVWGTFYWSLSVQDCLIPTVSAVSHVFFGNRVFVLLGCKRFYWHLYLVFVFTSFGIGITFGVLARLWSEDPWMPYSTIDTLPVASAANSLPTAWLSCAALIDGCVTATLLYLLLREKHDYKHTRQLVARIVRLTLETVLLTHIIGAILFILWLTSRTRTNAFWFFIEIISEMYALSILFTLNTRKSLQRISQPDDQDMIDRQLNELNTQEAGQANGSFLPHHQPSASVSLTGSNAVARHHIYFPPPLRHYSSSSVTQYADSPHDEKKTEILMYHAASSTEATNLPYSSRSSRGTIADTVTRIPTITKHTSARASNPPRDDTSGLSSLLDALKATPVLRSKSRLK